MMLAKGAYMYSELELKAVIAGDMLKQGFKDVIATDDLNNLNYNGEPVRLFKTPSDIAYAAPTHAYLAWARNFKPKGINISDCYVAYDDTRSGDVYVIVSTQKPEAKCIQN